LTELEIKKMMVDHRELHSEFQIDHFIVGSQGDRWAQYKQCLREISGRLENIRIKKAEGKLLKLDISRWHFCWPSRYYRARAKAMRQEKIKRLAAINDIISEYERELSRFLILARELKECFGSITKEVRDRLELDSWTAKGRRMAAIDRILTGGISHQTFEFILSLPLKSQNSILDKILPNDPERRLLIESLKEEVTK
jgi:hypothetical protein